MRKKVEPINRLKGFIASLLAINLAIGTVFFCEIAYSSDDPLVLGIFPRRNASTTLKLFRPMVSYLSKKLGREVKLRTSKNFKSFWTNVITKKFDLVHYNQYHYILSHKQFGYQVILKNSEFGESTIAGALLIRKDSNIKSIGDLKGKTIVFGGGPKAMQSYIVARYLLEQGGLKQTDYIERFAVNPPNAIFSAYYKQSDAAGAGDKVLNLDVVTNSIDINELSFLARGEQLPHLPWAVNASMPIELRNKIQTILSSLVNYEEGLSLLNKAKLTGLIRADDREYDRHRAIIKAVFGDNEPDPSDE
jgi:phosphonate transport system substrate-binding protein